jgi:MauM/NapG family ferredoxin protein
MTDDAYSKRELLRLGARRAGEAGAFAIDLAFESVVDRFTPHVQRPPGALGEVSFLLACTRCGECAKACPPGAIQVLDDTAGISAGTPFLDVNRHKPCVACSHMPCIPACADGALIPMALADVVMGTASIDRETCLAWNDGNCSRCIDACPVADTAMLQDEEGRVYIDPRNCIGCGMCRAVCPTDPKSITVRPPPRF